MRSGSKIMFLGVCDYQGKVFLHDLTDSSALDQRPKFPSCIQVLIALPHRQAKVLSNFLYHQDSIFRGEHERWFADNDIGTLQGLLHIVPKSNQPLVSVFEFAHLHENILLLELVHNNVYAQRLEAFRIISKNEICLLDARFLQSLAPRCPGVEFDDGIQDLGFATCRVGLDDNQQLDRIGC